MQGSDLLNISGAPGFVYSTSIFSELLVCKLGIRDYNLSVPCVSARLLHSNYLAKNTALMSRKLSRLRKIQFHNNRIFLGYLNFNFLFVLQRKRSTLTKQMKLIVPYVAFRVRSNAHLHTQHPYPTLSAYLCPIYLVLVESKERKYSFVFSRQGKKSNIIICVLIDVALLFCHSSPSCGFVPHLRCSATVAATLLLSPCICDNVTATPRFLRHCYCTPRSCSSNHVTTVQ